MNGRLSILFLLIYILPAFIYQNLYSNVPLNNIDSDVLSITGSGKSPSDYSWNINLIGRQPTFSGVGDIAVGNGFAYLGFQNILAIMEIKYAENPEFVSSLILSGAVKETSVYGNYVFAACGSSGLVIINVSNPKSPFITGTVSVSANHICISGSNMFVSGSDIRIFDLTTPANPQQISSYPLFGSIFCNDNKLYVSNTSGLEIVII